MNMNDSRNDLLIIFNGLQIILGDKESINVTM
jgi:hypothetical protein